MVLSASPSSQISTHPQAPPHLHPRTELAVLLVSVIVPAIVAAAHVEHVPDAAHDLGVVRVVGLGWTGAFRALDMLAGAAFAWLPLGTRAFRAGLATAAAAGIGAGLVFGLARRLVAT